MNWKEELKNNLRTVDDLKKQNFLSNRELKKIGELLNKYPMSITRYYFSLINKNDPNDPIRKLALPNEEEFAIDGFEDTSGEGNNTIIKGLQHKYKETALILLTNQCAMYCRHCFRKRMVGKNTSEVVQDLEKVIEYIKEHKEINNVLISGGDALLVNNDKLEKLLAALVEIDSIIEIRIATRTLVTFPKRIMDDELLNILEKYNKKKQLYVVTQFNHPNEITDYSKEAINELKKRGIIILNQTVMLKGVNDSVDTLSNLIRNLNTNGVLQYYIFQCRPTLGVKTQFQIPLKTAFNIIEAARNMQNGIGKKFIFCMSHRTGKIQVLYLKDNKMVLKYHEAKNTNDYGAIFEQELTDDQAWVKDIELQELIWKKKAQ